MLKRRAHGDAALPVKPGNDEPRDGAHAAPRRFVDCHRLFQTTRYRQQTPKQKDQLIQAQVIRSKIA
jgi:hypothetical protein